MNVRRHPVAQNRIVRRLQRHTRLTTLFRQPDQHQIGAEKSSSSFYLGEPIQSAQAPIVQKAPVAAFAAPEVEPSAESAGNEVRRMPQTSVHSPIQASQWVESASTALVEPQAIPTTSLPASSPRQESHPVQPASSTLPEPQTYSATPPPAHSPSEAARSVQPSESPLSVPQIVPTTASPTPTPNPTPSVQRVEDEDSSWRRLQKIFNLHQKKQEAETAPPTGTASEPKESRQGPISADASSSIQRKPADSNPSAGQPHEASKPITVPSPPPTAPPAESARPAVTPESPATSSSTVQTSPAVDPTEHHRYPTFDQLKGQEAAEFQTGSTSSQRGSSPDVSRSAPPIEPQAQVQRGAPDHPSEAVIQRTLTTEPGTSIRPKSEPSPPARSTSGQSPQPNVDSTGELDRPGSPGLTPFYEPSSGIDRPALTHTPAADNDESISEIRPFEYESTAEKDDDGSSSHLLPLEAIWPVQRAEEPAGANREQVSTADLSVALSSPPADPKLAHNIRQVLQRVSTQQPTQSSVEVVTPRRARPHQPPTVFRSEVSKPAAQMPNVEAAARRPSPQPEADMAPNQPGEVKMVPTEIGPLPSDLWDLLGQAPPSTTAQNQAQVPDTGSPAQSQVSPAPDTPGVQAKFEPAQVGESSTSATDTSENLSRSHFQDASRPQAPNQEALETGSSSNLEPFNPEPFLPDTTGLELNRSETATEPVPLAEQPIDKIGVQAVMQKQDAVTPVDHAHSQHQSTTNPIIDGSSMEETNFYDEAPTFTERTTSAEARPTKAAAPTSSNDATPSPFTTPITNPNQIQRQSAPPDIAAGDASRQDEPSTEPSSASPSATQRPAQHHAETTPPSPSPDKGGTAQAEAPRLSSQVQRQVEASEISPNRGEVGGASEISPNQGSAVTPESEGQGDSKAESAEAVDTDELARRVYHKLKNRLTVEWERIYRR
ncbi:MAG: hypothetical protein H6631_04010 [Anaerolineaceae bacterium]|nr:hypothetical protein [Anaerolineaceae bacterium]